MFQRQKRNLVPPINTTSTADISFILLVFFLVMTSMDIDKGLSRQLPPIDDNDKQETVDIQKDNLLSLNITPSGSLTANGQPLDVGKLRSRVTVFIAGSPDVRRHVIAIDVDRNAPYESYFKVQNEIMAAYNALRDKYALRVYGQAYARCTAEQREKIRERYPQRIAETTSEAGKGGAR